MQHHWMTASKKREAAIALNNIGVTLLHRQCYSDAFYSFDNSVKVIKSILEYEFPDFMTSTTTITELSSFRTNNNSEGDLTMKLVNDSLRDASQKLSKSTTLPNLYTTEADREYVLRMITVDRSIGSMDEMMFESPSASRGVVLRIDEVDEYCDDILDLYETLMEMSIVLGNIGTLCRLVCLNRHYNSKKKSRRVVHSALRLCEESFQILSYISENVADSNTNLQHRSCFMKLHVLHNMMFLTASVHEVEESRKYYRLLGDIQYQLNHDDLDYFAIPGNSGTNDDIFRPNAARAA